MGKPVQFHLHKVCESQMSGSFHLNYFQAGNGIGLTDGGTFRCATHWEPADLSAYIGLALTKVQFFANGDPDAAYVIKVYTGSTGSNEVLSQVVPSFTVDDWNEVILNDPIPIGGSNDLWFGYEVTHGPATYPAGCDDGPAIQYKGDMISLSGGAWVSMSAEYSLDYNWNIQGWVEAADGASMPIGAINEVTATESGNFAACGPTGIANKAPLDGAKSLTGYNVWYKFNTGNYSVLDFVTTESYTHDGAGATVGTHYYQVTAVYDPEGESDPTDEVSVVITSIEETLLNATSLFPNPASEVVNIESDFTIESLTIYNYSGQIIAEEEVNNTFFKVNTSKYQSGVYFFQIDTEEGRISKRIVIE